MGATGGGKTITFSYNEDGSRASKTVNGTRTDYIYNGSKVMRETCGGVAIDFIYDADGRPFAMKYNGAYYYYILNLQGDVVMLVNSSGATVARYEYDPYGKVISATGSMASINPLRYRGYYYDQETGLYFLMSRYYDPAICRFINADSFASTGEGVLGNNMFAYCINDPVSRKDTQGTASFDVVLDGVETPFDDWLEGGGRGGYAYAYNPIDAGYRYGVDVSIAARSSLTHGGIQNNGYVAYAVYINPHGTASTAPLMAANNKAQSIGLHTSGVGSPNNNINPDGSYTKFDHKGKLYSYTQFDSLGRQTMRIDFQGRSHAGVLPHVHLYTYPQQGGRAEYVFDLQWRLVD